jgi:hypothetical protein
MTKFLSAVLLLLVVVSPVLSGDEAFRAKVKTLPAPSEKGAFEIETLFLLDGRDYGPCVLSARPATLDGATVWSVRDRADMDLGESTLRIDNQAYLDARLAGLRGKRTQIVDGETSAVSWRRTEAGIALDIERAGDEPPVREVLGLESEAMATLSAFVLFGRLAGPEKAEYRFPVFYPEPAEGRSRVEMMTVRLEGPGTWQGEPALLVRGETERQKSTLALDPETGAFLGMEAIIATGARAEFLPVERVEIEKPEPPPETVEEEPAPGEPGGVEEEPAPGEPEGVEEEPAPGEPGGVEDRPATHADPLEAALRDPPATGMMVTNVVAGSQAAALGVRRGDVLVSYDGTPTTSIEEVSAAKEAAGEKETVTLVFARGGERLSITFLPGSMGLFLMPVRKGEAAPPLPPATGVEFDFSSLADEPLDLWYAFTLDGTTKVGFEHSVVTLDESGRLISRREVAFDGGEQWGLNHFDVTVATTAGRWPELLRTRFVNGLTGWTGEGQLEEAEDGSAEWRFSWKNPETDESGEFRNASAPDFVPGYLVETLAAFMPREKGACIRFRTVGESTGVPGMPAALLCAGRVEIEHGGGTVMAWLFEQHQLGGQIVGRYCVDDAGRVLLADYGAAKARLTTRELALAGLAEGLVPRTAK